MPIFKSSLQKRFKEQLKALSVLFKSRDYELKNCVSFGCRLEDVKTTSNLIETSFIKNDNTTYKIQNHSIGNVAVKGESGLVVFIRRP